MMRESEILQIVRARTPGTGDDAAVVPFQDTNLVLTTDVLHRLSAFPEGTTSMTIGLQSTAVSLSDLAAMGARPLGVLLAFGDPDLDERYVMGILEGATACCETAQTRLLGGEDYELLYTIPNERFRMELGTVIDRVVNNGISLRTAEREIPLANRGWEHGT